MQKILFPFNDSDAYQVYSMNPDGTDVTQLTTGTSSCQWATWSKSGARFLTARQDGTVWTYLPDGTDEQQITNLDTSNLGSIGEIQGDWSPDDTQIVLCYGSGPTGAQIVNVDNSGFTNVAISDMSGNGSISWSPDGTKLAFCTGGSGHGDTAVCNIDGSGVTTIIAGDSTWGYNVWGWFADSTNVFINAVDFGSPFEEKILKCDGGSPTVLLDDATGATIKGDAMALNRADNSEFVWVDTQDSAGLTTLGPTIIFENADGNADSFGLSWADVRTPVVLPPQAILFTDQTSVDFTTSPQNNIWMVEPDGSNLTAIVPATSDFWWSVVMNAAGTKLLGTTVDTTTLAVLGLWLMNIDGSSKTQITNMDSTSVDFLAEFTPQFSPDGTKCVLPYGTDYGDGANGISIVKLDNSGFVNIPTGPQHPTDDPTPWHPTPNGPAAIYWSPDGSKFAWNAAPRDDGATSIAYCDASGSVTVILVGSFSGDPNTSYSPVYGWFPDSQSLLIQAGPAAGGTVILQSDGTTTTTLYTDAGDTFFGDEPNALSPDGLRFAYYELSTGGLGVWDIAAEAGGEIVPVSALGADTALADNFVQWWPPAPVPAAPAVDLSTVRATPSPGGIVRLGLNAE